MGEELLEHRIREPAGEPLGALVLFHGRGTSEDDLFPLLDALDPDRRLVGITPRGPLSLPPGGAHWYMVRRVGYPDPQTFHATRARAAALLDSLPDALGVPYERIVLGGFSQGAVMSYALGLGSGRPAPAGILAMSGFIPTVEGFDLDLEGRPGLPVAITHGTRDPIIEVGWGREARSMLDAAGLTVAYNDTDVAHGVDGTLVPVVAGWLRDLPAFS